MSVAGVGAVLCVLSSLVASGQSVSAHVAALGSPDSGVRIRAAIALAEMGPAATEAIPALTKAVEDRNLNVRYWAGSALKTLGPAAAVAVPALMRMLKTFPGSVPELEGPARYFPDARAVAADALGSIGPAAKSAVPALNEATKDPDASVRAAAARALKNIRG